MTYEENDNPTNAGQEIAGTIYEWPEGDQRRYRDGIDLIQRVRADLDQIEEDLVREARDNRFTWDQIGKWLGTTRQGAFNKFTRGS